MSHSALSHAVGSGQQSGRGETDAPALEVRGLGKSFPIGGLFSRQSVRALHGVDLTIGRGEIVALVGESGSGKSTWPVVLHAWKSPARAQSCLTASTSLNATVSKPPVRSVPSFRWCSRTPSVP